MITTTDIANLVYTDCKPFGIALFQEGNIKKGKLEGERVVVHAKELTPERVWRKCFVEVNFLVPDAAKDQADLIRLRELERQATRTLKNTGQYDGTTYTYSVNSTHIEQDRDLECHYVNVKLLFKALNTIE